MKQTQVINNIFFLIIAISFSSCAHKTGHLKNVASQPQVVTTAQNDNNQNVIEKEVVKISNNRINARSDEKLDGSQIFERYGTAVFMIFTSDGRNGFQGSGFFIDNDGLAVSNYHVFKGTAIGMEQIKMLDSNTVYNVTKVIHKSIDEDFIIFRVNCNNTNYIPIASSKPKIGEKVYAIGSPQGLENTFSSGEVSQWRKENIMQTNVSLDHGSSGGALINEYGEVVGITSGTFDENSQANLNYAWSIDVIKPYLK